MTPSVNERTVPPGDDTYLEQTWKLKERIRRSDGVLKQPRAYFETEYRQETVYLLLLPDDHNQVIAFAVMHANGYLSLLGVAPEHRRKGLGTRLIQLLLNDHSVITCHTRATNQEARRFYLHDGFTVQRRIDDYYPDGTAALSLRLDRAKGG